jgi:dipeptidyl-peptidase-3
VLDASTAFDGLTPQEQRYALSLGKADWEGAKICLLQCSPESALIFSLLQLVFSAQPVEALLSAAAARGLSDEELQQAIMYAAGFYGNMGNYKSFGDTKLVPALPATRMEVFLTAGAADSGLVGELWTECAARMYSLPPRQRQLGLGRAKGISTYFSANCEEHDAEVAGRYLEHKGLSPYNTRLFKSEDGFIPSFTVLIASATLGPGDDAIGQLCGKSEVFEKCNFTLERGDCERASHASMLHAAARPSRPSWWSCNLQHVII